MKRIRLGFGVVLTTLFLAACSGPVNTKEVTDTTTKTGIAADTKGTKASLRR